MQIDEPDITDPNIRLRIMIYRLFLDLGIKQFSDMLEVNYLTYREYENGNRKISNSLLTKIEGSPHLKINLLWLCNGKGNILKNQNDRNERSNAFSKIYRVRFLLHELNVSIPELAYYLHLTETDLKKLLRNSAIKLENFNGSRELSWSNEYLRLKIIKLFNLSAVWFDKGTGEIFKIS